MLRDFHACEGPRTHRNQVDSGWTRTTIICWLLPEGQTQSNALQVLGAGPGAPWGGEVARQVLAPKPRSLQKSAAEGPNDRLQADLVDCPHNTRGRNKHGLVVTDVFTREVATKALPDKRAETLTQLAAEIMPDLVSQEGLRGDNGSRKRVSRLEGALPEGVVHRQKDHVRRVSSHDMDHPPMFSRCVCMEIKDFSTVRTFRFAFLRRDSPTRRSSTSGALGS